MLFPAVEGTLALMLQKIAFPGVIVTKLAGTAVTQSETESSEVGVSSPKLPSSSVSQVHFTKRLSFRLFDASGPGVSAINAKSVVTSNGITAALSFFIQKNVVLLKPGDKFVKSGAKKLSVNVTPPSVPLVSKPIKRSASPELNVLPVAVA